MATISGKVFVAVCWTDSGKWADVIGVYTSRDAAWKAIRTNAESIALEYETDVQETTNRLTVDTMDSSTIFELHEEIVDG